MNIINNLIRNAIISKEPKNIAITPYDGIFELSLAKHTVHNFYMMHGTQKNLQPIIRNSQLLGLSQQMDMWPVSVDVDLIICNDITSQIEACKKLSRYLHVPLLIIHHCIKPPFVKLEDVQILVNEHRNDTIVSMSESISNSWYINAETMPYYVPITNSDTKTNQVLIIGSFVPEHLNFVRALKEQINNRTPVTVIGQNQNFSENATLESCIELLKKHRYFINLYNESEIHPMMLYAMGAGCTVISTPGISEEIIQHGKNGYIFKSIEDITKFIYKSPHLGKQAQETMKEKYKEEDFSIQWNKLIDTVSKKPFLG